MAITPHSNSWIKRTRRTRIYCPKLMTRFPKFGSPEQCSPFLALTVLAVPTPKRGERQYRVLWVDVDWRIG